jgi:cellulose biosynthesis protein BcsQ
MVKDARTERRGLPKTTIIPSRVIPNTVLARDIRSSLKQFNETISPSISQRVAVSESCIAGLPVNLYAPNSPSHKEFKELMKFILTNLRK